MVILTIKIKGKRYNLVDTLKTREYREAMSISDDITTVMMEIKDGKGANIQQQVQKLSTLKLTDWQKLEDIVKRCFAITQKDLDEMRTADAMLLFTAVWQESTNPKKKLFEPSTSE